MMCRPQSFIWNNWHTGSEGRVNVQKPEIFQGRCHQILSQLQLASGPACVLSSPNQVQQGDFLLDTVHKNRVKDRHTHWYYTCIHWYISHPIGLILNVTGTNQTVIINECLVRTFYKLATFPQIVNQHHGDNHHIPEILSLFFIEMYWIFSTNQMPSA